MTHPIDPRTTDLDNQETSKLGTRLAFENAYRLKKKALLSEIEHTLGFSLHDVDSGLSGT